MLEPSSENPLNLEAYSHYMGGPQAVFDGNVQKSIAGDYVLFVCVFWYILIAFVLAKYERSSTKIIELSSSFTYLVVACVFKYFVNYFWALTYTYRSFFEQQATAQFPVFISHLFYSTHKTV